MFVFFNILNCRTTRRDSRGVEPREGIRAGAGNLDFRFSKRGFYFFCSVTVTVISVFGLFMLFVVQMGIEFSVQHVLYCTFVQLFEEGSQVFSALKRFVKFFVVQ